MHESLSLLSVALGSKGIDAVGDILEERLEVAVVCHVLLQQTYLFTVGVKMVFVVVVKKISIYLFAYHFVGDDKLRCSAIDASDSHHAEIV